MRVEERSLTAREGRTEQELSPAGWHDVIPRETRPVCRTISRARLWWEFKDHKGPRAEQSKTQPEEADLNEGGCECGRGREAPQPAIDSGEISERVETPGPASPAWQPEQQPRRAPCIGARRAGDSSPSDMSPRCRPAVCRPLAPCPAPKDVQELGVAEAS